MGMPEKLIHADDDTGGSHFDPRFMIKKNARRKLEVGKKKQVLSSEFLKFKESS